MKKSLISKIAAPLIVAGSFLAGITTAPETAEAQRGHHQSGHHHSNHNHFGNHHFGYHPHSSFGHYTYPTIPRVLHFNHNNHHLPISHRNSHLINHFSHLNYLLSSRHPSYSYPRQRNVQVIHHHTIDERDGKRDGKIHPNCIEQTYLTNCWNDKKGDGNGLCSIDEYDGLNKKTFNTNEEFSFGMHIVSPHFAGSVWEMKIYDPKGNQIGKTEGIIKNGYLPCRHLNLSKVHAKFGEGKFSIAFYLNGKYWNKREFELKKTDPRRTIIDRTEDLNQRPYKPGPPK